MATGSTAGTGAEEELQSPQSSQSSQSPPSIMDAFLTNPIAFLAGAFVGVMELDVLSEDSAIGRVLRGKR